MIGFFLFLIFIYTQEICRDAWDYSLTKAQLDDKVAKCRKTAETIVGFPLIQTSNDLKGEFSLGRIVDLKRADWLNVNGANSLINYASTVESDTIRFKEEEEKANRELIQINEENKAIKDDFDLNQLGLEDDGEMGGGDLSEDDIKRIESKNNQIFADETGTAYNE